MHMRQTDNSQQLNQATRGEQDLWSNGGIFATNIDLGNDSKATQLCLGSLLISFYLVAA